MSRVHRVRTHVWRLGRLEVKDAFFGSEDEALAFANNSPADSIKVYNHDDTLTHDLTQVTIDTYA
jgi:hypothetical protein